VGVGVTGVGVTEDVIEGVGAIVEVTVSVTVTLGVGVGVIQLKL
jgi:hypothetical protein